MYPNNRILLAVLAISIVLLSGCATIVSGKDQSIAIKSQPSQASVTVRDETGAKVFDSITPTTVTLQKGKGYFKKKSYTIDIAKEGYAPRRVELTARASGWYLGGNLLFGGLIGWLIVDPMTGAMYTLTPKEVDVTLPASSAGLDEIEPNSISVTLLEDMPSDRRDDLVRIN